MARILFAYLIGLVLCCSITPLYAYPVPVDFNGKLQRWNITNQSGPITYYITGEVTDLESLKSSVTDALEVWQAVPSSYITFDEAIDEVSAEILVKLVTQIDGGYSSGFAETVTDSAGNVAKCTLNLLVGGDGDSIAFRKTALHELGHCIGLGHSLVPESIMSYKIEKNDYALDTDDIAAITRLYPVDGGSPELPRGCSVLSKNTGSQQIAAILVMFPIVMIVFGRKYRIKQDKTWRISGAKRQKIWSI